MQNDTKHLKTTYSKAEILKHNKVNDCWIIVENLVFDISPFIAAHPGGVDVLMSRAGEDATSFFMMKHGNNEKVIKMLKRYQIGALPVTEQIPQEALNEPFIDELNLMLNKERLFTIEPKVKTQYFIVRSLMLILFFCLSIGAIYFHLPIWLSALFIIFQALIGVSLFGLIAHESTHGGLPKNKILDHLLTLIWPIIWPFISRKPLLYEHNSHHTKIGDEYYDFEVAGFSKFIKYSSNLEKNRIHKYQHKLAKFLYPFYANIITTFGGITSTFWKNHNIEVALYHTLSLVLTFSFYVLLPSLILGPSIKWFLFYLIYQGVLFTGVYVGAAINHFIPFTFKEIPVEMQNKYGYYICHHTSNFGAKNSFWFWFTGGFNIQIEHHLSPFIPVENLRKAIPIVQELCKKYDYPYINFKDFSSLWNEHYAFLEKLADGEEIPSEIRNKQIYQAR